MIDGMEQNDLEYGPLGQFSDGFEETEPNADLLEPGNMIYFQKKAEPLPQRFKQRIHVIPLPKIHDDESDPPSEDLYPNRLSRNQPMANSWAGDRLPGQVGPSRNSRKDAKIERSEN
jgi:hypothetical protein